jgi:hypothetical protein
MKITSLQYISDSTGQTTGVFIPINEWNDLKNKFKGIEQEEIGVPEWQMDIVRERALSYKNDPKQVLAFTMQWMA